MSARIENFQTPPGSPSYSVLGPSRLELVAGGLEPGQRYRVDTSGPSAGPRGSNHLLGPGALHRSRTWTSPDAPLQDPPQTVTSVVTKTRKSLRDEPDKALYKRWGGHFLFAILS